MSTTKAHGLVFNEAAGDNIFTEVLGVTAADTIRDRFELYLKDERREIKTMLAAKFGSDFADNDDVTQEDIDSAIEEAGLSTSFTRSFGLFLESPLFTGLNWKPKTPSDYFALGGLFMQVISAYRAKGTVGKLACLAKALTE